MVRPRRSHCWALLGCGALFVTVAVGARESSKGYDADLTLFSPEGRLYQVEYVMRAVGQYGSPMVGVHGEGCCVVACKRDVPDELVYPESVSNIFRITDNIYSAATGLSGDVRYQVKRARLQALEYKRQYGSSMPSRLLALAMADAAQVNTQHAALRPMASVSFFISVDDPTGPALFRVEPSGQVYQAWGTAAGRGSAASLELLEETFKAAAAGSEREEDESNSSASDSSASDSSAPASASNRSGGDNENAESEVEAADDNVGGGEKGAFRTPEATGEDKLGQHEPRGETGENSEAADDDGDSDGRVGGKWKGAEHASKAMNDAKAPAATDGGRGSTNGVIGFGVAGEGETVELALRALSKASSGTGAPPLTDKNVEIAIASRETGIRICSRKEVRGFLGKMAVSAADCAPRKFGR